ncbi:MAG: tilS [Acidimicrobiales bacterium]|nr:tilS [Acidimicrobiales bacterium]
MTASPDSEPVGARSDGAVELGHPVVAELLARCPFPVSGTPVTAAVSGGADSLALLVLAVAAGCRVTAVHVDHGLRPGSADEATVVASVARRLGAGFRAEQVVVTPGPNLEARARQARYGVLPTDVLTGHTADDRAETMLLNLVRGAGPTGLVGIRRSARRPMLDLRRHETVALCGALRLEPVQDPSNADPAFRRNRVRAELLPLLADLGDRDPVPVLVRQADLFAELDDAVAVLAGAVDPTSAAELRAVARPVAGAAIRAWLLGAGIGDGHPADAGAVDRILAVATNEAVACELPGAWRVARTAGRLRLVAPGGAAG